MKIVIDYTYLPTKISMYDGDRLIKIGNVESLISGSDMVIDYATMSTFAKIRMKRLIYKAVDLFKPEQIIFEEK